MNRILIVHNYYQEPGGEDRVVAAETSLLESRGHHVVHYTAHNDDVSKFGRFSLARNTIWNQSTYRELRAIIRSQKPDVVHFHNVLPLLSPSVYYAAKHEHRPIVQTLHNYRLFCPGALFLRDGKICELCINRSVAWPAVVHACYRQNRAASGVVSTMLATHRLAKTWTDVIDMYISLTDFARQKFITGGLPADKIVVKPNFVADDPGIGNGAQGYALFVGRLSQEKGIDTLLNAWSVIDGHIPLKIIGDGPLAAQVAERAQEASGVEWLGMLPYERVLEAMRNAYVLVLPSKCYEGFPMTIAESYATGLPVITSRHGSVGSLVDDLRTGLHFRPNDAHDLAAKAQWAFDHPHEVSNMRSAARLEYETNYSMDRNYDQLIDTYSKAKRRTEGAAGRGSRFTSAVT